ncbi:MAG: DUF4019 domain-containing protein [Deltaproteobacteria bacterium]|nr:DUF4019 domain-containing protein [Deltaproteobacteria bacterium]MBW2504349.1 DUF4019 domain-containing protein [Deltaproteobacteria bacterium]
MIPKQFRIHAVLIFACLVMIMFPLLSERPDADKAAAATAAAQRFFELIDSGEYARSWDVTSAPLRAKVSEQEWVDQLNNMRARVGPIIQRSQKNITYSPYAHDQPDGEYIVLTYDSQFKGIEGVTETVTVMLDQDSWRVAGYFIQ